MFLVHAIFLSKINNHSKMTIDVVELFSIIWFFSFFCELATHITINMYWFFKTLFIHNFDQMSIEF
jgi:hypothetical protein